MHVGERQLKRVRTFYPRVKPLAFCCWCFTRGKETRYLVGGGVRCPETTQPGPAVFGVMPDEVAQKLERSRFTTIRRLPPHSTPLAHNQTRQERTIGGVLGNRQYARSGTIEQKNGDETIIG